MRIGISILGVACFGFLFSFAQKKNLPAGSGTEVPSTSMTLTCQASTSKVDLDVNNVRAMILGSSDMWWDLKTAHYEIPKGSLIHSVFAGALWVGAIDNGGQLKVAAQTYRQRGQDFWPGPLDTVNATIADSSCWKYNRVWKVDRWQVEEFIQRYNDPAYTIPKDILEWAGNGDLSKGEAHFLAPFFDKNADGKYNAHDGDYPGYAFSGTQNCQYNLLGDQTLWWIFNDAARAHTETGGGILGLEIHAQAFAYQANNEINDATFYQYKVINRSTSKLDSMYWGQWVDSDLGEATDDYTGCDVKRGLGYCYNGDSYDDPPNGYGLHPPAVGCDFLGGPLADSNDGVDNDRDSVIDEVGERLLMSNFLYYDGGNNIPWGHPGAPSHFYFYLKSKWGDGMPMTYGGNGYNSGGLVCKFMFPGDSDPYGWGTGGIPQVPWDEITAGNPVSDRKFLVSAGPFTMDPGEVQYITHGIIWARDTAGDHFAGLEAMKKADDKAQLVFDNCFSSLPCAPPHANMNASINYLKVLFSYYGHGASFLWNFGDGSTSTQKYPTHTYAVSGLYKVCLKVSNACGADSVCKTIEVANMPPPPWGFRVKRIEGNGNAGQNLDWLKENYDSILASPQNRILCPIYDYLSGPVNIGVYDTTLLPKGKFIIKFDGLAASAKWKMYRVGVSDTAYADSSVGANYLQKISKWGIQIRGTYAQNPGTAGIVNNGFIEATMDFSDPAKKWLSGVADSDFPDYENWIRSGKTTTGTYQDYIGVDDGEAYENLIGGTWAPYRVVATTTTTPSSNFAKGYYTGPGFKSNFLASSLLNKLASVDLVITADKSKWTRCVVLELCEDTVYSQNTTTNITNKARKLDFRRAPSVDKNGNTTSGPDNNDYSTGMGWFPGYAVNVETGERLNICFGENSALVNENGNDMKWNPTSNKYATAYKLPWDSVDKPVFGGQHYIYILGHNSNNTPTGIIPIDTINIPRYDKGARIRQILSWNNNQPLDTRKREIFADAMWVNLPLLVQGQTLLSSDVKIRLRVSKPYQKSYSAAFYKSSSTNSVYGDSSTAPENRNYPMYEFDASKFGLLVPVHTYVQGFTFFPNPFVNAATLLFENSSGEEHELRIFDIRGRLVRDYKELTGQSVQIERGSFTPGIYFYTLSWRGKRKAVGKFIVASAQ